MESISSAPDGLARNALASPPPYAGASGGWDDAIAHWVSQVASPPVTALATVVTAAAFSSGPAVWFWASLQVFTAVLLPTLYVVHLYARGRISDLHMNVRAERVRPCVSAIGCASAGLALLHWGGAPRLLVLLAAAYAVQSLLFLLITRWWKISLHGTSAGAFASVCWMLSGWASFPLLLVLPLVAWSRIHLNRHTVPQVVCGTTMGAGLLAAALLFAGHP